MNPANRTRRAELRNRRRTHQVNSRLRRRGTGTASTWCMSTGLPVRQARSMGSSLRRNAEKAACQGVKGRSFAGKAPARECTRYPLPNLIPALTAYRPRRPEFRAAKAALLARATA